MRLQTFLPIVFLFHCLYGENNVGVLYNKKTFIRARNQKRPLISSSQMAYKLVAFTQSNNRRLMELMSGKYSRRYQIDIEYLQDISSSFSKFGLDMSLASRSPVGMGIGIVMDLTLNPLFQIQSIFSQKNIVPLNKYEVIINNYKNWVMTKYNSKKECMSSNDFHKLGHRIKYDNITFVDTLENVLTVYFHPGFESKFSSLFSCFTGRLRSPDMDSDIFHELFPGTWLIDHNSIPKSLGSIRLSCGSEIVGVIERIPTLDKPHLVHYHFTMKEKDKTSQDSNHCRLSPGRQIKIDSEKCKWNPFVVSTSLFSCYDLHDIDYVQDKDSLELMLDNGWRLNTRPVKMTIDIQTPEDILFHCTETHSGLCKLGVYSKIENKLTVKTNSKTGINGIKIRCIRCPDCIDFDPVDKFFIVKAGRRSREYKCDNTTVKISRETGRLHHYSMTKNKTIEYLTFPISTPDKETPIEIPMSPFSVLTYKVPRDEFKYEQYNLTIKFDGEEIKGIWRPQGNTEQIDLIWTFQMNSLLIKTVTFDFERHVITMKGRSLPINKVVHMELRSSGKICPSKTELSAGAKWCSDIGGNSKARDAFENDDYLVHDMYTIFHRLVDNPKENIPSESLREKFDLWDMFNSIPDIDNFMEYIKSIPDIIIDFGTDTIVSLEESLQEFLLRKTFS